jgi:iron complex outermembrane receptor protein
MRATIWAERAAVLVVFGVGAPAFAQSGGDEFGLGEIVVVGARPDGSSIVGGSVVTRDDVWTFDRGSLDQAVNLAPGVVSTFDANGRRNEADIFVRGFGRAQVPLLVDGVRIYLPADNRLDFGRFLTADIAAVQIQKGYASVLDGPGAMGGLINIVTTKPSQPFEAEGGLSVGGRGDVEGSNGYLMLGTRRDGFYAQGSFAYTDRDSWSLSGDYVPTTNSLEDGGERLGSDSADRRVSLKLGFTPNGDDEYSVNYLKQQGEKGAPLNVYNAPPVPPNSFWRWPYWDVENLSFLSTTRLGEESYFKAKAYYNTFENGLDAYDTIAYTSQSNPGRFRSPYDDEAYGTSLEYGTTRGANTLKAALHYRDDNHTEQQTSRPTNPTLAFTEPEQEQSQETWSVALENTFAVGDAIDVVAGISYDDYRITKAEEFTAGAGLFEHPHGGADAFNWQAAFIRRYGASSRFHASVSDRARFPTIFELYSTRFGTATPNPDLGPEQATNVEVGWETSTARDVRVGGALFYSDVRDLIQTVVLPDTTTQTQNVGDGRFYGLELSLDAAVSDRWSAGGHYTFIRRTINDALQPNLRPTGVPTHKAFLYTSWQPTARLALTPSLEVADDRWSDVNPAPAYPYVETGAYALVGVDAKYTLRNDLELAVGGKNLLDEHYELAWGYPQPGRSYYMKLRMDF